MAREIPPKPESKLPSQEELERRRIVGVHAEHVSNISSTDFPGHYPGEDHSWDLERFRNNFKVQFHNNDQFDSSFSLIGLDASVANAFRRILLAEIPTVAIEECFVMNNTSIIQDEVLCHRLGLIPLKGKKEGLNWLKWFKTPDGQSKDGPTDHNTIIMHLQVECTWNERGKELVRKGETDPKKLFNNSSVYAHQFWMEKAGKQIEIFKNPEDEVRPVNPDILIAKLRPGQAIDIKMYCVKGVGGDHAKFSPVATATYRLLPHIAITRPILGADAQKFARCFPKGVIGLQPVTADEASRDGSGYEGHEGEQKAVVVDPMKDTVTREALRHEEFKDKVKLGRVKDHFIFSVESTGQWDSDELFLESVKVLKIKCERMKRCLGNMVRQTY